MTSAVGATAGKPFAVTFSLANFGDADAAATKLDVVLNLGDSHTWKVVSPPFGCTTWSVTQGFPQNGITCRPGAVAAGASKTFTLMITSTEAGNFSNEAFAYSTVATDDHNDDGAIWSTTVGPAVPGGGGNALQALLIALLAALHL